MMPIACYMLPCGGLFVGVWGVVRVWTFNAFGGVFLDDGGEVGKCSRFLFLKPPLSPFDICFWGVGCAFGGFKECPKVEASAF